MGNIFEFSREDFLRGDGGFVDVGPARRPERAASSRQRSPATSAPSIRASGWNARPYRSVIGKTAKARVPSRATFWKCASLT